ncbi:hypothetical protein JMUB6875_34740 [Nocardia sp. JMUB6875]|uniref:O-antigen ligase family protein n=1 Tax=Nocardia sp. JMUB6875 TaxID=3158170 RepID=UPI0032E69FC1
MTPELPALLERTMPPDPAAPPERSWFAERAKMFVIIGVSLLLGLGVMLELSKKAPGGLGVVAAAGGFAAVLVVIGLRDPRWAFVFMMLATFLRPAIPKILPVTDPFVLAFGGLVIAALAWIRGRPERRVSIGPIEIAMLLYVLWNLNSILQDHEYAPILYPLTGEMLDLRRYLIIGTVMPFATYLIARMIFARRDAAGFLVGTLLGCSAYSAWVSILQFYGPRSLIWPKYIAYAPAWAERACGLPNQPEVNGLILIVGFVLSLVLISSEQRPRWQRIGLAVIAAACAFSVYLTHTRSIWLDFAVVVLIAIVVGKGFRTGFVVTAIAAVTVIALNWSTFTSSDRKAGGVASTNEVYDRLNADMTAVWAWTQKPFSGWGLGRFVMVNTYRHQQYSPTTPWERGLGIPAHETELGILAELGIVGLLLWLTVLALLTRKLLLAYLRLPTEGLMGRPLAFTAAAAFVSLVLGGVFVDLRLFDYPSTMVFALVGAAVGAADRLPRPPKVDPLEAGRAHREELRAARV